MNNVKNGAFRKNNDMSFSMSSAIVERRRREHFVSEVEHLVNGLYASGTLNLVATDESDCRNINLIKSVVRIIRDDPQVVYLRQYYQGSLRLRCWLNKSSEAVA